jgi:hypothetical protein
MRNYTELRLQSEWSDSPQPDRRVGRVFSLLTGRMAKLFIVVLAFLSLAAVACTPQQVMEVNLGVSLNKMRVEKGLPQLPLDPALSAVARMRAEDMANKDYFGHQPPDGCDFRCLLFKQGVPVAWGGEIIAWNNALPAKAISMSLDLWRNSPAHFAIITGCQFTRMGTGAAIAPDGRIYHVALFEGNSGCPPPP